MYHGSARLFMYFFFSSRRRHTRSYGDWSSDVCSSDLRHRRLYRVLHADETPVAMLKPGNGKTHRAYRSEERRVGKECRSWGWLYQDKKNHKRLCIYYFEGYRILLGDAVLKRK